MVFTWSFQSAESLEDGGMGIVIKTVPRVRGEIGQVVFAQSDKRRLQVGRAAHSLDRKSVGFVLVLSGKVLEKWVHPKGKDRREEREQNKSRLDAWVLHAKSMVERGPIQALRE